MDVGVVDDCVGITTQNVPSADTPLLGVAFTAEIKQCVVIVPPAEGVQFAGVEAPPAPIIAIALVGNVLPVPPPAGATVAVHPAALVASDEKSEDDSPDASAHI